MSFLQKKSPSKCKSSFTNTATSPSLPFSPPLSTASSNVALNRSYSYLQVLRECLLAFLVLAFVGFIVSLFFCFFYTHVFFPLSVSLLPFLIFTLVFVNFAGSQFMRKRSGSCTTATVPKFSQSTGRRECSVVFTTLRCLHHRSSLRSANSAAI